MLLTIIEFSSVIYLKSVYFCKHIAVSLIITQPTNALIVCHLFLNHFFKTLSLLEQ